MAAKAQRSIAIIAALIVLFSTMWDPRISVAVSIIALVALGIYQFMQKEDKR